MKINIKKFIKHNWDSAVVTLILFIAGYFLAVFQMGGRAILTGVPEVQKIQALEQTTLADKISKVESFTVQNRYDIKNHKATTHYGKYQNQKKEIPYRWRLLKP